MPLDCTVSLVVYNNPPEMLRKACESLFQTSLTIRLYVVDNSPTPALQPLFAEFPAEYHRAEYNLGYGQGHNLALRNAEPARHHLIMNPDIIIHPGTLETLAARLDGNPDFGMVTPLIVNKDGSIQHLNKRYPAVFDLFARRFLPTAAAALFQDRLDRHEMKDQGYESSYDVECATGAFMYCRQEALAAVGSFDARYFMYFEDCDLSRKFQQRGWRTVFCPEASVTHLWERASYRDAKLTRIHIRSMFSYFNKWGWKWV